MPPLLGVYALPVLQKVIVSSLGRHLGHLPNLSPLIVRLSPIPPPSPVSYVTLAGTPANLSLQFWCQNAQLLTQEPGKVYLTGMRPPSPGI